MKIVFLAPFGIRPKGTVIARMLPLAVELQAIGHQVVIVAPPYTNPEDSGRREVVCGVVIKNISLGPDCGLLAAILLSWRMFSAMKDERPDLIHLFKPKGYGGFAAMLQLLLQHLGLTAIPLVVDTDDLEGQGGMNDLRPYSFAEKLVFAFQEKWLLRHARFVTVASRELEQLATVLGGAGDRVCYLPNGVSPASVPDRDKSRSELGIADGESVVLLYTRFFEFTQERLHSLLEMIFRRMRNVRFLVVGKGTQGEEQALLLAAKQGGYASALVMAGWVEPKLLPNVLSVADVAVYPFDDNQVNRSKCPAKLTELLNLGIPVVADRVGQIAEYIRDGETGVLCNPDDMAAMAEGVQYLLSDQQRRLAMGTAARQMMNETYSWAKMAGELSLCYQQLTVCEKH